MTNELQHIPGDQLKGCVVVPAAGPDHAIEVTLFFASPSKDLGGAWPGQRDMKTELVAEGALPSGERLFVVHRTFVPPQVTLDDLDAHRERLSHMKDTESVRARFGIVGLNEVDGSLFIVEGAVHPDVA